jgi:hypothetical protein
VSILIADIGGLGRWCGVAPRSNLSMMIMQPPQQGQEWLAVCGSAALALLALMASTGMTGGMSSSRARATFSARLGIGSTPCRPVVAEDIRDLQLRTGHDRGQLRRRLHFLAVPLSFSGPLLWARQLVERALDGGDHAGGNARVACRRVQFVVTQKRLDDSDISSAFEQVGREAVAQGV